METWAMGPAAWAMGRAAGALAMLVATGSTGCWGSTSFESNVPIVVMGTPPPRPPPEPPKEAEVIVTDKAIVLPEKIQFDVNKWTIKPYSHRMLDNVAEIIKRHERLRKIAIEGFASSEGGAEWNQTLSTERARAVRDYLEGRGVEPRRLTSRGYGITRPVADNDTEEGREKNRRTEFNIVEQDAPIAPTAPVAEEKR